MATELESRPWAGKIFVDGQFRDAEGIGRDGRSRQGPRRGARQGRRRVAVGPRGAVASARGAQPAGRPSL